MSISVAASIFAMFAAESRLALLYPWVLPRLAAETFSTGETRWTAVAVGCLVGLAFAVWGCRDMSARDVV